MTSIELAWKIRMHSLEMTHISKGSHLGLALSVADIIAVLYSKVMYILPTDPKNDKRDRFILSKGHAGAAVYAALAEMGFFALSVLKTHYADGSLLSGHVSHKSVPGVEISTGSLGHGPSMAAGMALAGKMDGKKHGIFVIVGDGEMEEGSVWEAIIFSAKHKLDNLTLIIDRNHLQALESSAEISGIESFHDRMSAFGWSVVSVDGHDHEKLYEAILYREKDKPHCVVAETIKGKGISFMENSILWHYRDPQGDLYLAALQELKDCKP